MNKIDLEARTTHRYRDGWSYLDNFDYVGTALVTPFRDVTPEPSEGICPDPSEGPVHVARARIPAGQDRELSIKAIRDHYRGSSCRCEHDCCGCASHWANVRPVHGRPREFSIRISTTYNY